MSPRHAFVVATAILLAACATVSAQPTSPWTQFVPVAGQPEPVPAQWVATPEGQFAHAIKIPNPVPKDSGYQPGMSSQEYFEHLCQTEAGEFIYKTVDNVEGFYFMRPPKRPTDEQLKDRYALEAPELERLYQAIQPNVEERAHLFISPPKRLYRFIEMSESTMQDNRKYIYAYGYRANLSPIKQKSVETLSSQYGLTWRGIRRSHDRELGIAGSEWIIISLKTNEVLAVKRQFARTGKIPYESGKVWWLNAVPCPNTNSEETLAGILFQIYKFPASVIKPVMGDKK